MLNKRPEIVRIYLPPDANTLLSTYDRCLRSRHQINVVVAGKQPQLDWLSADAAELHCARGAGIWQWAGHHDDDGAAPEVVLACAGEVPTLETLAAAAILRERLPQLRFRVINVVDLMRLLPETEHPHGLPDSEFDTLFTTDSPVIFPFHGYPWLIHRLTYRRRNHAGIHVRGYKERGAPSSSASRAGRPNIDMCQASSSTSNSTLRRREAMSAMAGGSDTRSCSAATTSTGQVIALMAAETSKTAIADNARAHARRSAAPMVARA